MVDIQQSNKNVFVTLQAQPEIYLSSKSNEPGFIKINFPNISKPVSYYCNKCVRDETLFECLILFASGLPSSMFTMNFSCEVELPTGAK